MVLYHRGHLKIVDSVSMNSPCLLNQSIIWLQSFKNVMLAEMQNQVNKMLEFTEIF